MSLIKWKPLNNEIDTFDSIIEQFFNDLSYDPRFSLMNTNNVSNYYNENDEEREKIANNGFKKVLENHTQKQRVQFLIEKYNEWKNSH